MGAPSIQAPALKDGTEISAPRFASAGYVVQGRGNGDARQLRPCWSKNKNQWRTYANDFEIKISTLGVVTCVRHAAADEQSGHGPGGVYRREYESHADRQQDGSHSYRVDSVLLGWHLRDQICYPVEPR